VILNFASCGLNSRIINEFSAWQLIKSIRGRLPLSSLSWQCEAFLSTMFKLFKQHVKQPVSVWPSLDELTSAAGTGLTGGVVGPTLEEM
jgi:hypothetical protein